MASYFVYHATMRKLFLFDIDGTLVKGGGENRFVRAINSTHAINITNDTDFSGYTDYLILKTLLEREGWDAKQIDEAIPQLMKAVDEVHKETFEVSHITIFPGVKKLLEALDRKNHVLGLITGNLKPIAQRKLESLDIWKYFTVGGFGSDPHLIRADLVDLAIERAGYKDKKDQVYVIGDTELDIEAAHKAGVVNTLAVSNGLRSIGDLKKSGAKVVLKDFTDTSDVLRNLGVGAG